MERKRVALIGGGIVVLLALIAAVVWFGVLAEDETAARPGVDEGDPAAEAADAFAAAWQGGTLDKVAVTSESGDIKAQTLTITSGLGTPVGLAPTVEVTEMIEVPPTAEAEAEARAAGDEELPRRVRATLAVEWGFGPERTWAYDSAVELVEDPALPGEGEDGAEPRWLVDWTPAVVHSRLVQGDGFTTVRLPAARGEILGLDGQPLVGLRPVVQVGIVPGQTADPAATAQQVAGIVGVDAAALVDRVEAAGDGEVVSVITLRQEAFDEVSASLGSIDGVTLDEAEIPLAPTRDFARGLIGTVGPATTDDAIASEGRVAVGDFVGRSGLQAAQDEVLAGKPGLSIRVMPDTGSGREPYELKAFPTEAGKPVTITIDPEIQAAADAVMSTAPKPAALVAIRVSTGDVLAVANGPSGSDSYNRAMVGKYPPGSTFKVASTLALLEGGLTPETIVDCPATIVVGKEFKNAEGEVLGPVPFSKDFADSCNTAFVGQSRTITAQELADAAASLGYRSHDLGVPVFGASVPITDDVTEHAADMIGQGQVEASPFTVALASASVASGRSLVPRLIVDPANSDPAPGAELPAGPIADLRELMRGVVTGGTGSAVLGIPGGDVAGKTGTAEFGTEDPPESHAWFTGYQGDIAFAVLVEGGGFGGQVAAPIAADFLTRLAGG